jgi:hypothetical protein
MDQYIVIGYDGRSAFQVHAKGLTVKQAQDSIAETAADRPHIIYTVVLEEDYRAAASRTMFNPVSHDEAVQQYRTRLTYCR